MRRSALTFLLCSVLAAPAPAVISVDPPCGCDCGLNGPVEVSDLVVLVNVNLGRRPVASCPSYLLGGLPSVGFLVQCVNALIDSEVCPLTAPATATPTRRVSPTPTVTGTIFPPPDAAASAAAEELLDSLFVCATAGTPGGDTIVHSLPAGARLECTSFTGHNGAFSLLKYPSTQDAEDELGEPSEDETVTEIAGGILHEAKWNPFCEEQQSPPCSRPDASSTRWAWQRQCWVARGETFDDTGFVLTPQGPKVANAFAGSTLFGGLLGLCPG